MCGFCTPGFVVAAVALLEKHPNPTPEQAKRGAGRQHLPLRHLQPRSGGGAVGEGGDPWLTILRSPRSTPPRSPTANAKYKWPAKPVLLGTRTKRLDGPDKVSGRARYSVRHQSARHAVRAHPAVAASACARAVGRSVGRAEGAGREGGARRRSIRRKRARPSTRSSIRATRWPRSRPPPRNRPPTHVRLIKVQYEVLPHLATIEQALRAGSAASVRGGQRQGRQRRGDRRSGGRIQGRRARCRADLFDAGADARQPRDARLRVRVAGRQPDGVGLDAGRARHARRVRRRAGAFRRRTSA